MIIPKHYGGLEFSAYAHSCVLVKLGEPQRDGAPHRRGAQFARARRTAAALRHRGAEGPLPAAARARRGNALLRAHRPDAPAPMPPRSPTPASSAAACRRQGSPRHPAQLGQALHHARAGRDRPRPRLPALRPRKLLGGDKTDIGITCALIPRDTPGVKIGRRHFPLNVPFQNGPLRARTCSCRSTTSSAAADGRPGLAHAGRAALRRPLHLAAVERCRRREGGRSLPPRAYARIRRQFNLPLGKFEGVEEALARMAGTPTSSMRRAPSPRAPSISARSRRCLRPSSSTTAPNSRRSRQRRHGRAGRQGHLPRAAELPRPRLPGGADLDHRRGRQHPHAHPHHLRPGRGALPSVRAEGDGRRTQPQDAPAPREFDRALFGHIGYAITNAARSLVMALTIARFSARARRRPHAPLLPAHQPVQRVVRVRDRRRDADARRLPEAEGVPLGAPRRRAVVLYLASMVLKHYENQGRHRPTCRSSSGACRTLLYEAQEQLHGFLRNFPTAGSPAACACSSSRAAAPTSRQRSLGRQIAELVRIPARRATGWPPDLPHGRAGQSVRPAAGSAGAGAGRRAAREAHTRRGRQDRPRHRARRAGPDRAGAGRRPDHARRPPRCATTTARSCTSSTSTTSRPTS